MYSYDRRSKLAIAEDLSKYLRHFGVIVETFGKDEARVKAAPDDYMSKISAMASLKSAFDWAKRYGASALFQGVLQQYALGKRDRVIIERALKEFSKKTVQRPKPENAVKAYLRKLDEYREYLKVAERTIREGVKHGEGTGTQLKAGPFTLVNAGGFSDDQMQFVQQVVASAAQKLQGIGLGRVCYGTVQVTNKITSSGSVLAYYQIRTDEFFVRGNLKGKGKVAEDTIIHELAHRLQFKFYSRSQYDDINRMYRRIQDADDYALSQAMSDPDNYPKPGERVPYKRGRMLVVEDVVGTKVRMHLEGDESVKLVAPLQSYVRVNAKNRTPSAFVTPYASTDPNENFAEMVSAYALGRLPADQVEMLREIIG